MKEKKGTMCYYKRGNVRQLLPTGGDTSIRGRVKQLKQDGYEMAKSSWECINTR